MGFFWDTAEEKRDRAIKAAQAEVMHCFQIWTAQKEIVAEKTKCYELIQTIAKEAQNQLQRTAALYESALTTMGIGSEETRDLKIRFTIRETEFKAKWQQVLDARKVLDAAIQVMVKKENDKIIAEEKLENILRPKAEVSSEKSSGTVEKASVKVDPQAEFQLLREQAAQDSNSALTATGKLRIPESLLAHFKGNNREHVSTVQTAAVREEISQTHASTNFAEMHKKLANTLRITPAKAPAPAPVQKVSVSSDSSSSQEGTRKSLCHALELRFKAKEAPQVPVEIKAALAARRKQIEG